MIISATSMVRLPALRTAVIEFCRKSLYWQEEAPPVTLVAGTAEYTLTVPAGRQVVGVLSVNLNDESVLYPATLEQVERALPRWRSAPGDPSAFVMLTPDTLRLAPVPTEAGPLTATVAYAPTRTSNEVLGAIYDRHFEAIKHGSLARLKAMAGHSFYDPQAALYYTGRFNAGVMAAAVERNKGFSRANLRVAPRAFV